MCINADSLYESKRYVIKCPDGPDNFVERVGTHRDRADKINEMIAKYVAAESTGTSSRKITQYLPMKPVSVLLDPSYYAVCRVKEILV